MGKMTSVVVAAAVLAVAAPAQAGDLEFIINPYFMAPNMNGKAALGPIDRNVSQSPSDILSNLNWGAMGSVEVNNGNWGANFDVNYMNLNVTDPDIRNFRTTGHQAAYTATVLKRIHENAWVYAGVRWSDMGVRFRCDQNCRLLPPIIPGQPRNIDISRNKSWQEGVVGFRATLPFNDKFDLTFNGDVGGIFAGSDISVNAWPQLGWKMSQKSKLMLGYRVIYVKYQGEDDGARFVYDMATFGPTLGVEFRF